MTPARGAFRAPLAALFALAVTAIAWIGSSVLCTRPLVIAPADMPAMAMDGTGQAVMLCPVVIGLIVFSSMLSAWALVALGADRHRSLTLAVLLRSCSRRPLLPVSARLMLCGALALAAIASVDGVRMTLAVGARCGVLVILGSIVAVAVSLLIARLVLALGVKLGLIIPRSLTDGLRQMFRPRRRRQPLTACAVRAMIGHGLRAPPSFVQ